MNLRYLTLPYSLIAKPLRVAHGPLHAQIEPTDACNQKCIMCYRNRLIDTPARMTLDQFKRTIDEVGATKINISGLGEPLLHTDIFSMVRYAHEKGAGITFPSNMTLAHKHIEDFIDSGIDVIKVSLDAAKPDTYRRIRGTDQFNQVVDSLRKIKELKMRRSSATPHIRINFALQRENVEELVDAIRLGAEVGAEALYVQYLDYVEVPDLKGVLVDGLTKDSLTRIFREARQRAIEARMKHNLDIWLRDIGIYTSKMHSMGTMRANDRVCYFPWISTFVEANGDVKACPIFTRKRHVGKLGNVFEQPFAEIWNGKPYRDLRRDLRARKRPFSPCQQCVPQSLSNIFIIFSRLLPGWKP